MSVPQCPWDDGDNGDSDGDEWLFSSLRRYSQLLMFDLTVQPQHVALDNNGNTMVVGDGDKEELVVYRVPSKLLAGNREQEGLTSNRDFGLVAGTVSAGCVRGVEFLRQNKLVTCREGLQGVEVWGWGEEDLINKEAVLDKCVFYPEVLCVDGEDCYAGGLHGVGRVRPGDTAWCCRKVDGEVTSLYSDGEGGLWAGQSDGVVSWVDWRVDGVASELRLGKGVWSTAFLSQCGSVSVVGVNSEGSLSVWDTRNSVSPVLQHTLCLSPTLSKSHTPQIVAGGGTVMVGVGDTVSVYQAHNMTKLFTHDGHKQKDQVVKVTSITLHPTVDRLVFSGDDQQRLQAWMYHPDNVDCLT